MLIALAAGGTGGHIVPALAVSEGLKQNQEVDLLFVGTGNEIERRLIGGAGYELVAIPFVPFLGKGLAGKIKFIAVTPLAICRALALFIKRKPRLLIAFGGYPSFAPIIAAWILRIPRVLHESNTQVGMANRFLSLFSNKIFAVIGASGFWTKKSIIFSENPVRSRFDETSPWRAPGANEPLRLAVLGGSQGAMRLNDALLTLAPFLSERGIKLIHQTGARDLERVTKGYESSDFKPERVAPFIDEIPSVYSWAHLVVARAGAMTVAEIKASGRPAIFVPLRIAQGHQAANAKASVEAGTALIIEDNDELAASLKAALEALIKEPETLKRMGQAAMKRSAGESGREIVARESLALIR